MLMLELEQKETIFIPIGEGRDVEVMAPADSDGISRSITIKIPDIKTTDQVLITIGSRRYSIMGGERKHLKKTRLAFFCPDDCRFRFSHRDRKPRKEPVNG